MALFFQRAQHREEEGESVFVSMTDLSVSFLLIILILLAFFAAQLKPEFSLPELDTENPLAAHLEKITVARTSLLYILAEKIREQIPGIRVSVIAADGVIRFRGDDLFAPGEWRVPPGSTAEQVARAISDAFADTLPCYTVGENSMHHKNCNANFASIETIQIEGHTDITPLSIRRQVQEKMRDNLDLSARRGAETLRAAAERYRPELMTFLNLHGQPVLSFAGYGAMRPIAHGATSADHATNRRIDIRFILQTPQNMREVAEIRTRLLQNLPNLPSVNIRTVP